MKLSPEGGQSLLEIVIAIGLALIISTGLVITTVNGLKNSQFSKNQAQATKYAQEAIDQIRTIRDRDYAVCGPSLSVAKFSDLWPSDVCSLACTYTLKRSSVDGYCPGDTSSPIWLKISPPAQETIGNFNREIKIETFSANQKKVTVKVSWTDISGNHESQLVTILANN